MTKNPVCGMTVSVKPDRVSRTFGATPFISALRYAGQTSKPRRLGRDNHAGRGGQICGLCDPRRRVARRA